MPRRGDEDEGGGQRRTRQRLERVVVAAAAPRLLLLVRFLVPLSPLAVMIGPQTATIVREASGVGSSRYMSAHAAIVER